jgi:K+-transporting ATPase ATPase C chain
MTVRMLRPAISLLAILTVLIGLAYPALITGIARVAFPRQALGSLVLRDGEPVGSALIGQSFTDPGHFWGRPSATTPKPYDSTASTGSNLGPTNPALIDSAGNRAAALRQADPDSSSPIPVDLVTASASGLDPDISVAAARYQSHRVSKTRGLPQSTIDGLINAHLQPRTLGLFGEPRVNVLEINLALDDLAKNFH